MAIAYYVCSPTRHCAACCSESALDLFLSLNLKCSDIHISNCKVDNGSAIREPGVDSMGELGGSTPAEGIRWLSEKSWVWGSKQNSTVDM